MANQKEIPRWFPIPFLLIGAYVVLLSLDLLPYTPNPRRRGFFDGPHHWQITGIGIAFVCAGLSMLIANRSRWLSLLVGAVLLITFMTPMVWFFYFSGAVDLPMQVVATIPLALGGIGGLLGLIRTAQGRRSLPSQHR